MASTPPPPAGRFYPLSAKVNIESRPATVPEPGAPVSTGQAVWLILLNELVPGLLALFVVGGLTYSAVLGHQVPDVLSNLAFGIAAFYFGVRGRGPVTIGR
jgi:hypothetical protein